MTKKIIFLIVTLCTFFYSKAENVTGFQIQASYLENGKLKVNSTGSTPFKIDIGFTRYNGGSGFESADFDFKLVAFNSSTGQVVDLTLLIKVGTSDFGTSNYVQKTYDVGVNYSNLNIPINSLKIALLWKSSRAPAPVGSPLGFNYFNTDYQVAVVTTTPSSPTPFYRNSSNGKIFVKIDEVYRHIYDQQAFSIFNASSVMNSIVSGTNDPTTIGMPLGSPVIVWDLMPQPNGPPIKIYHQPYSGEPLLVQDAPTGKVYFVEKIGGRGLSYYARHIVNIETFNYFKFNSSKVTLMTIVWNTPVPWGTPATGWNLGPDLTRP